MKRTLFSIIHSLFTRKSCTQDTPAQSICKWERGTSLPDITPLPAIEFKIWAHLPIHDEHSSQQRS